MEAQPASPVPSPADGRTLLDRVFLSAERRVRSGWVVAAFALIAGVTVVVLNVIMVLTGVAPQVWQIDDPRVALLTGSTLAAGILATVVCRVAFKEQVGLAAPKAALHLGAGAFAGAALVCASVLVAALATGHAIELSASMGGVLASGLIQVMSIGPTSVGEELLLRGVPLRALSRGLHPAVAVGGTGLVFGALHLTNPNASLVAGLNVALVGLWFGALALRTSLWTSIGAHVAWNWFEGFVLGQPVSGIQPGPSLFKVPYGESGFWSGGAFGPEASGLTSALLLVATVVTVAWPKAPHQNRLGNTDTA